MQAYLEDVFPPDLQYAVTIRSPVAKGVIELIQFPDLPPGYSFLTAKDIPGTNKLDNTSMPILAEKNLSYIGEPVGIIIGPDKVLLEDLAGQFVVNVIETKPVLSLEEDGENPIVREILIGDGNSTLSEDAKVVTGNYATGIQDHWYAEPSGAITWYKNKTVDKNKSPSGETLIIKTATQWPFHVKRSVAMVLGMDPSFIMVEPTPLSIHLDGKLWFPSLLACHAALGTYITKKPVRFILNKEEDFLYSPKRCESKIDIATTIDENGKIKTALIDISVNLGAYEVNGNEILDQVCLGSMGNYVFENLRLVARTKRVNIPPQGPFSGFGLSQGAFAIERHVSKIAGLFDMDPSRWRKERAAFGKYQMIQDELIENAAKSGDYYRKWAAYELLRRCGREKTLENIENPRGIGIALGFQGNGLLYDNEPCSVEVTLTKENILEIKANIISPEDYRGIWEKIAIEIINPASVKLIKEDAPDCGPSCASRNITEITRLVSKCCQTIRKQRLASSLPITARRALKARDGTLLDGVFTSPAGKALNANAFSKPAFACAVVEVSIDMFECVPKIRGVWLSVSCGKVISVHRAKRSLTRGAAQALGWAFAERVEYINGILPQDQYENFLILSPADIPPIYIDFIKDDNGETRGIGELPFACVPAAFSQAVSQAMDFDFNSIPLKRKEMMEMIRKRKMETREGVK